MEKYNGWSNYATWQVKVGLLDTIYVPDFFDMTQNPKFLGQQLKNYVIKSMKNCGLSKEELYSALDFLGDVNWREIAKHMIDEWVKD